MMPSTPHSSSKAKAHIQPPANAIVKFIETRTCSTDLHTLLEGVATCQLGRNLDHKDTGVTHPTRVLPRRGGSLAVQPVNTIAGACTVQLSATSTWKAQEDLCPFRKIRCELHSGHQAKPVWLRHHCCEVGVSDQLHQSQD